MTTNLDKLVSNTDAQATLGQGDGVSGTQGIYQDYTKSEASGSSKTKSFSYTYIHFMGPGTEYSGATIETNADNKLCFSYDWGASIIPFNYVKAAAKSTALQPYMSRCNSYRILGHKVTMFDLICSRDEVQTDGRIVSTPQSDTIEVFSDTNGKFRPHNIVPIVGNNIFEINECFDKPEPDTVEEATIPRVKVQFPPEMYLSTKHEKNLKFKNKFNCYNGLFDLSNWQSGTPLTFEHNFDSGRIPGIPVGTFADQTKTACNKNELKVANNQICTFLYSYRKSTKTCTV